jgi:hypothetical protein
MNLVSERFGPRLPRAIAAAIALLVLTYFALAHTARAAPLPSPVTLLPATATVGDAKRLALVIGNGSYRNITALKNPVNDATAVANRLRTLGFQVYFARDVDRLGMNEAIAGFLAHIEQNTETVVYYSGHGIEVQGSNYLLPIDIPELGSDEERLLRSEAISLTDLLFDLESRRARVSLVILDACRNNPFHLSGLTRGLGSERGLARVDPPRGSFVIFSAGAGEEALDNLGLTDNNPNGLFTRVLLQLISEDGLELRTLVRRLRGEVREAAFAFGHHSQVPSYYDQLLGDFYFRPKAAPVPTHCDLLVHSDATIKEILAADVEAGIRACSQAGADDPNEPRFVHLLYEAQQQRAVQKALGTDVAAFSEAYLTLFPSGRFTAEVKTHLAELSKRDTERTEVAKKAATLDAEKLEAAKAEIARAEIAKAEAANATAQAQAARAEAAKAEAAKAAAQAEAAKAEAAKAEIAKAETAKAAAQVETARAEATKAEAAKAVAQADAARIEAERAAAHAEMAKAEAAKAETAKVATQADATKTNKPDRTNAIGMAEIAALIQIHLKRVGCDPGSTNGDWTAATQHAVEAFNTHAGTKFDVTTASLDLLDAVRGKPPGICPLVCERGYRVENERCVRITCEAGLDSNGNCQKRKERPQTVQGPTVPPKTSGKCFTFNGKQFCE